MKIIQYPDRKPGNPSVKDHHWTGRVLRRLLPAFYRKVKNSGDKALFDLSREI